MPWLCVQRLSEEKPRNSFKDRWLMTDVFIEDSSETPEQSFERLNIYSLYLMFSKTEVFGDKKKRLALTQSTRTKFEADRTSIESLIHTSTFLQRQFNIRTENNVLPKFVRLCLWQKDRDSDRKTVARKGGVWVSEQRERESERERDRDREIDW